MFCKTCGSEINDHAIICPKCGCSTQDDKVKTTNNASPEEKKKMNIFCLIGFIFSLFGDIVFLLSFVFAPLGFVFSLIGIIQANKKDQSLKGLAIAGIILSAVPLLIWILAAIAGLSLSL